MFLAAALSALAYDFMDSDGLCYNFNSDGMTVTVTYEISTPGARHYQDLRGNITIPFKVNYNGIDYYVTAIDERTFQDCYDITGMTMPSTLRSIGSYAFLDCTAMTSLIIPDNVTSIGRSAFFYCYSLTDVTIGASVTDIGEFAFSYCSRLKNFKVKAQNTKFDSRDNCNAIIETASNTLRFGCPGTVIPNSVTAIGNYAFYSCSGINTEVIIPPSVTEIGYSAFNNCSNMPSVTIPASVKSIGSSAFDSCYRRTSINAYPNPAEVTLGAEVFQNVKKESCVLHVRPSLFEAYSEADQWKDFDNIIGDLPEELKGDLNGDGSVDGGDVSILLEMVLAGGVNDAQKAVADLNGDGDVDGGDVSILLEMVLSGD